MHALAQIRLGYHGLELWQKIPALDTQRLTDSLGSMPKLREAAITAYDVAHIPVQYLLYGLVAGVVSAVLVAVYFFIASLFDVNFNELFAAQRIEGYKGFLRMHIDAAGTLTIYAIGLRRVRAPGPSAIRWQWRIPGTPKPGNPWFRPRLEHRPHLIEKITIPAPQART